MNASTCNWLVWKIRIGILLISCETETRTPPTRISFLLQPGKIRSPLQSKISHKTWTKLTTQRNTQTKEKEKNNNSRRKWCEAWSKYRGGQSNKWLVAVLDSAAGAAAESKRVEAWPWWQKRNQFQGKYGLQRKYNKKRLSAMNCTSTGRHPCCNFWMRFWT